MNCLAQMGLVGKFCAYPRLLLDNDEKRFPQLSREMDAVSSVQDAIADGTVQHPVYTPQRQRTNVANASGVSMKPSTARFRERGVEGDASTASWYWHSKEEYGR